MVKDWPLVLEFVKAASGLLIPLLGVGIASWFGARAYKQQKLLERRTRWYEAMVEALDHFVRTYALAVDMSDLRLAENAMKEVQALVPSGYFFIEQAGYTAVAEWLVKMRTTQAPTQEGSEARRLACMEACQKLANVLSAELRRDYGLKPIESFLKKQPAIRLEHGMKGESEDGM